MGEIKTDPYLVWIDVNDDTYECEAFGPDHTLADIARWLMKNPVEAEEVRDLLAEMLEEQE